MKVAIIYDTNTPFTTGVYFHRAFQELGFDVTPFHQDNIKDVPEGFGIYFVVDSGPTYTIPKWQSGPSIYYAIDTHLDFETRLEMARSSQLPVMAQLTCGAQRATDRGLPTLWVPLACDPWIHQDYGVERDLDVAFVGHLYEDDAWRITIKQKLLDHGFAEDKIFVGEATKEEMGHIYSRAKIVINHTVRENRKDINMRVFEAMSSGAYLVTQKLVNDDMSKILDHQFYSDYETDDQMFNILHEALDYYDSKYKEIASNGKMFVRSYHTYALHLKTLLTKITGVDDAKN